ncbi:unnamed protein product [Lupinus luteus]|uniref:Uncharacterized protein n=1 Tax=Lupinus luteus TaxID=3873 RepID=A0AAV1XY23_LUPLU
MAGLQQYNFFPTDFFYPKPQPSSNPIVMLPLHKPNIEDKNQHQQPLPKSMVKATTPSTSPIVYTHKSQQSLTRVDNKGPKFST